MEALVRRDPGIGDEVWKSPGETGLAPSALQLEITERLSVSKVGGGRADRHFIQDLVEENGTISVIVRSVLSIGRRRERDVVAEGLEDTPGGTDRGRRARFRTPTLTRDRSR